VKSLMEDDHLEDLQADKAKVKGTFVPVHN
jgi:hypothetical protein